MKKMTYKNFLKTQIIILYCIACVIPATSGDTEQNTTNINDIFYLKTNHGNGQKVREDHKIGILNVDMELQLITTETVM